MSRKEAKNNVLTGSEYTISNKQVLFLQVQRQLLKYFTDVRKLTQSNFFCRKLRKVKYKQNRNNKK